MKEKNDEGEIRFEHCPTEQMWADIKTKPKQGAAFREFRGHVMGIPNDYNDDDYRKTVPSKVPKSMLPVTKAQLASKECVGGNMAAASLLGIVAAKPNKKVSWDLNGEKETSVMNSQESIRMVQGRKWSMTVYQSCRLKGEPLARAWKHAFIE
jgi:hypothetical protein